MGALMESKLGASGDSRVSKWLTHRQRQASPTFQSAGRTTLSARGLHTQLYPCPECDRCGLHRSSCRFYIDRSTIQDATNPNHDMHSWVGHMIQVSQRFES